MVFNCASDEHRFIKVSSYMHVLKSRMAEAKNVQDFDRHLSGKSLKISDNIQADVIEQEELKERMLQQAANAKTGLNGNGTQLHSATLQLQIQYKLEEIDRKLEAKRKEVIDRREALNLRWHILTKKQQQLQDKMKQYSGVIEESRIIRYKALQRTGKEDREHQQKEAEAENLKTELAELKEIQKIRRDGVQSLQPVVSFLEAVFKTAPDGYFDSSMVPASAVMKRYHAMVANKEYLQKELTKNTDQVLKLRGQLSEKTQKHQQEVTLLYNRIAKLRKKLEVVSNTNIVNEDKVYKQMKRHHCQNQNLYSILSAVENLSMVCNRHNNMSGHGPKKQSNSVNPIASKLQEIEDFVCHTQAVVDHANMLMRNEVATRFSIITLPALDSHATSPASK